MSPSEDDDRILRVEVTGLRWQGVMTTSHYTFKVPYRSLARTLQFIKYRNGTIVQIQLMGLPPLIQNSVQSSAPLDAIKVEAFATQLSSSAEANPDQPLPVEVDIGVSKSRLPSVDLEREMPELSQKLGVVMLLIEKLRSLFGNSPDQ